MRLTPTVSSRASVSISTAYSVCHASTSVVAVYDRPVENHFADWEKSEAVERSGRATSAV